MKTYGSTDIQKIVGITKMQVVHWTQTGAVIPFKDARGRGGRRRYSEQNKIEFGICRELNGFGIPPHIMATFLDFLRKPPEPPHDLGVTGEQEEKGVSFWDRLKQDVEYGRPVFVVRRDKNGFLFDVGDKEGIEKVMAKREYGCLVAIDIGRLLSELGEE
jgi:DNA-binding transcriptional MerR regulator